MLENRLLFHVGSDAWTLAGACSALGFALLVVAGVLFTLLVRRNGYTRRLSGSEASALVFDGERLGLERRVPTVSGPAVGVEARVSFTIGDLRRARQAGNQLLFWGGPAMIMAWSAGFGFLLFAGSLWARESIVLVGFVIVGPMLLSGPFMPWAAVYTKLE